MEVPGGLKCQLRPYNSMGSDWILSIHIFPNHYRYGQLTESPTQNDRQEGAVDPTSSALYYKGRGMEHIRANHFPFSFLSHSFILIESGAQCRALSILALNERCFQKRPAHWDTGTLKAVYWNLSCRRHSTKDSFFQKYCMPPTIL